MQRFVLWAPLVLLCGALPWACATTGTPTSGTDASLKSADSGMLDRHEAIQEIATVVCERYKTCNGVGPKKKYTSQSDCEIQQRDEFNKRWPETECAKSGLHKDKYIECRERVKQYQCSNNLFDFGGILTECGASKVCK